MIICHWCDGSGIDEDAERAADIRNCPNCHGTRFEPDQEDEDENDE